MRRRARNPRPRAVRRQSRKPSEEMQMTAPSERTPLVCLYHWERSTPDAVHFTQPVGGGQVVDYTWKQILDRVRRMAAHLQSRNLPPKSNVALVGKNSAHWIMCDWAIWMAGHVTVPLYPTHAADTVRYIL